MFRRFSMLCSLAISATAEVPRSGVPANHYMELWENSPFTSRPVEPVPDDALKNYYLGGISKFEDGYFAILLNGKKPDEKIVVFPGEKSEVEVLNVVWPVESWRDVVVTVRIGSVSGNVRFDGIPPTVSSPRLNTRKAKAPKVDVRGRADLSQEPPVPAARDLRPRISLPSR